MERKKLELELNNPTHLKLLFDDPIVGESQYGKYYLYAVRNGDGTDRRATFSVAYSCWLSARLWAYLRAK